MKGKVTDKFQIHELFLNFMDYFCRNSRTFPHSITNKEGGNDKSSKLEKRTKGLGITCCGKIINNINLRNSLLRHNYSLFDNMKGTALFFIFVFILSCSADKSSVEQDETIEIIDCKDEYISLADSLSIQFIPLETTEECLIGSISDIQIKNNLIYILEGKKSEDLFIFDMNGKFITKVGEKGNGPEQYVKISSFDIDSVNNQILISDKHRGRILFFDLKTYRFNYAINTDFYYTDFISMSNRQILFFGCNGFRNPQKRNDSNSYYIQMTDSLLNPESVFLKAVFTTPYVTLVKPGKSHFYRKGNNEIYIYHHLFPDVWRYTNRNFEQKYLIKFENYVFPDLNYLKGEASSSGTDKDYSKALYDSNYITSYRMDECSNLICFSIQKNLMPIQAIYSKKHKKGYLFTLKDYYRSMNMGMLMFPAGATDDCIIGVIPINEDMERVKEDMLLYPIVNNKTLDDNPIICLYRWKKF
ncbi:6-bladed beta-propeller [Parabacteroides sp.]